MRSNVTAILVAQDRDEKLDQTIAALGAQTVAPDRIIVVAAGSEEFANTLGAGDFDAVIRVNPKSHFGAAIDVGVRGTHPFETHQHEWLWLLAADSAPEPDALAQLLLRVKSTATAAVAGPKLVDWDDPSRITELSQGLTWAGSRWVLDHQELDQQQYDHYEDVLGVGPVGMLVRRDVWQRLGGFDPALPVYDDGLDFSVRARLAGYRVIVAPAARLRFARSGIAGPEINHRESVLRRAHRRARAAQLHRRVTYAPALLAPFIWLALPLIGVLGMMWALIRERPGTMVGELWSALNVFVHPGRIRRARKLIRTQTTSGWRAVGPLRADRKTVKSVRMVRKESMLAAQGRHKEDLHFVQTGGLALTVSAVLIGIGLSWWMLDASFVTGGGVGQLSQSLANLWGSTVSAAAVNVQSLGSFASTIPADPFTWILALLGTITFWNPSFAIILLFTLALPLAALGGWMWTSRLTDHAAGRILAGIAWATTPVLMSALISGRVTTVVLTIALPWFFFAASRSVASWSWAGVASFVAAFVFASAPILIPAGVVMLIAGICANPRGATKLLAIAIVPLTLFAPQILSSIANGRFIEFFTDPGIQLPYEPAPVTELLLGFPTTGFGGLPEMLEAFGIADGVAPWIIVLTAAAPMGVLAAIGLVSGNPRGTVLLGLAGIAGLATAMIAPQIAIVPLSTGFVPVWAGSGLAVYVLALISLAVIGTRALFRAQLPVSIIAMVGVVMLAVPGLIQIATSDTRIEPDRHPTPAVVSAELRSHPHSQALVLTPLGENETRAELLNRNTLALDRIRTTQLTTAESDDERARADLVASLVSLGAGDVVERLTAARIKFVLLRDAPGSEGTQLRSLMQEAFDQSAALAPVGATSHGLLWRVNDAETDAEGGDTPSETNVPDEVLEDAAQLGEDELDIPVSVERPVSGKMLWGAQLILLGLMVLLALPTGEVREKPARRRSRDVRGTKVASQASVSAVTHPASEQSGAVLTADRDDEPVEAQEQDAQAPEGRNFDADDDSLALENVGTIADDQSMTRDDVFELPDEDTIFVGHNSPFVVRSDEPSDSEVIPADRNGVIENDIENDTKDGARDE